MEALYKRLQESNDAALGPSARLLRKAIRPPRVCSKCSINEDDARDGYLSEMSVITQPGEEGFSHVTMWLCGECEGPILKAVMDLGFKNHMHGGTAFLQDHECEAGYDSCQEPRGYGEYVVGNPFYSEKAF
jgi:hypothetical protein